MRFTHGIQGGTGMARHAQHDSITQTNGNLHPLLNGESLKKLPAGHFENRMSQIWSIFKQMFENTVHFQTDFEKIPLAPPPAAPKGRCRALERGIFQNMFENEPYFQTSVWKWTISGSSCFQTRHLASFSKNHHLAGDASYQSWARTLWTFASARKPPRMLHMQPSRPTRSS